MTDKILVVLILLFTTTACAQLTPEQKKMMKEAEKKAAEAQKMHDSIMNTPQMKKAMEQMDAMDAQYAKGKKPKESNSVKQSKKSPSHLDRYTISGGNAQNFMDWPHGNATIVLVTQPYNYRSKEEKEVGTFSADGSFSFSDFGEPAFDRSLADFFKCEGTNASETQYTHPETGIIPAFFSVRQNGKEIGTLHLATSKQQAYNNSPAGKYRGDPGYRLQMFYVDKAAEAKATCTRKIMGADHAEITKQIEITDIYALSFSPGWNYVKKAIEGSQNVGEIPYYKVKRHTVEKSKPNDVKWVFAKH